MYDRLKAAEDVVRRFTHGMNATGATLATMIAVIYAAHVVADAITAAARSRDPA